jgi:hypothetical protein
MESAVGVATDMRLEQEASRKKERHKGVYVGHSIRFR